MGEKGGSATPIVELTQEEIDKLSMFAYQELKQTVSKVLLTLSRYGVQYPITVDSLSRILGEVISMEVDAEKCDRSEIEVMAIELIMDQGREMTKALKAQRGKIPLQQTVGDAIDEATQCKEKK